MYDSPKARVIRVKLATKFLLIIAIGFAVLWGSIWVLTERANSRVIESQAKTVAATVASQIRAARAVYTRKVVGKLQAEVPGQVRAVARPAGPGEIPLPAVFVHDISDELNRMAGDEPLATYSLISGWNINPQKGLGDDFEREGFQFLRRQEDALRARAAGSEADYQQRLKGYAWKDYWRVETDAQGRHVLRYFAPDLASAPACVSCHNALEQTPEVLSLRQAQGVREVKKFTLNELMGGISIKVPIEQAGLIATEERRSSMGVLTAVMLGIGFMVFLLIRRSTRQIRDLSEAASRIIQERDFRQEVSVDSSDEIGQLSSDFSNLVRMLRDVLLTMRQSGQQIAAAAETLTESTVEQNQAVTRQATALNETQVTAQEIKQTSEMAAAKAHAVVQVAERADGIRGAGITALQRSMAGLGDIREQVGEIAKRVSELGERTRQIGGIAQTVKDLADQSNILALNAAIEAVRSGEHGKGFAVVAREIRALADQSIQATSRVKEILTDIRGSVEAAVAISEAGQHKVESGLVQIKASGDSIQELADIMRESMGAARQIGVAVTQQNAGIAQIFTAVTDQSQMAEEAVKRIEQTHQAASVLKSVTEMVTEVVGRFHV